MDSLQYLRCRLCGVVAHAFQSVVTGTAHQFRETLHRFGLDEQLQQQMQVCDLRCIQSLFVPFLARRLGHELHQFVVAILRGMLLKISPGRFQCFVPPAESG
jgi:hypothetical protein